MPRPYWSGQIQISLVSFGVQLFVAAESKSQISFHQISRSIGERVRHPGCHARVYRTKAAHSAMPPLLPDLWRQQHPKGHKQVQLAFASTKHCQQLWHTVLGSI